MKKLATLTAATAIVVASVALPANGSQGGTCPGDYRLVSAKRFGEIGALTDLNGNGRICLKEVASGTPGEGPIIIDDNLHH